MLKKLMEEVHDHLEMPELNQNFGTQMYEQQVVELSQAGERGVLAEGVAIGAVQLLVGLGTASRGRGSASGGGVQTLRAWPL